MFLTAEFVTDRLKHLETRTPDASCGFYGALDLIRQRSMMRG